MQAVRADPTLAEGQFALGYVNWMLDWDWTAAEAGFRLALALDPGFALGHHTLGHALSQMGRHSEGFSIARRAPELDPLYAMPYAMASQVAFQARDYPAARDFAQQAIVLDEEFWIGHLARGQAYEQLGQNEMALEALTTAARLSCQNSKANRAQRLYSCESRSSRVRPARCCRPWTRCRWQRYTCRPTQWRSCTQASVSARLSSTGSTARTSRMTCISCICPSIPSGIPTEPILDSWLFSSDVTSRVLSERSRLRRESPRLRYARHVLVARPRRLSRSS